MFERRRMIDNHKGNEKRFGPLLRDLSRPVGALALETVTFLIALMLTRGAALMCNDQPKQPSQPPSLERPPSPSHREQKGNPSPVPSNAE